MKEEKKVLQESGNKKIRLKITFSILILTALFVVELYLMMNYSTSYLFIGIVGLAILCFVYLITDFVFKLKNENESYHDKDYESVYKAQKVSYVFMKQSFLDVERTLDRIREICEVPTEELIQAQKAVGRVTIQRNKENARAVVDSNEKIAELLHEFDHNLKEMLHAAETQDHDQEIIKKQQEMIEMMENTNAALREEISSLGERTETSVNAIGDVIRNEIEQKDLLIQEKLHALEETEFKVHKVIESSKNQIASEEIVTPQEFEAAKEESVPDESVNMIIPEGDIIEESAAPNEPDILDEEIILEETAAPEEGKILEEPVFLEEEMIPEDVMIPEEPVLPDEMMISEEPVSPDKMMIPEEPVSPDKMMILEESDISENEMIPENPDISEEIIIPEVPVKQEESKEEKVLESGKTMTPDEIAALLDDINDSSEIPESEEETSSMPDMSDPGHVMTPEEIAALLANM